MMAEARPAVTSLSRLPSMLAALRQDLVIDESLNVFDLQDLAHKLGELGQRGVIFRAVPAVPFVLGGIDYVKIQQPQANELFARIRGGKRLGVLGVQLYGTPVSPANVTVQVLDNNSNGRAERVVRYLQDAGFQVLPLQAAPARLTRAEIMYTKANSLQAQTISRFLAKVHTKQVGHLSYKANVVVIVGPGFKIKIR